MSMHPFQLFKFVDYSPENATFSSLPSAPSQPPPQPPWPSFPTSFNHPHLAARANFPQNATPHSPVGWWVHRSLLKLRGTERAGSDCCTNCLCEKLGNFRQGLGVQINW
ncbi:hypothetical protein SDJN03_06542, partial [Cucurbita argyrosperma subsp. sororia]